MHEPDQKIAVIGAGIAGLSAAWLLSRRHDVSLYEREDRAGGHVNTVAAPLDGSNCDVDTGFIVYNDRNYPNLVALFDHLGVATRASDMSFAVSLRDGALEYGSDLPAGLFAQRRNILRPGFWRMLADLRRFYREAPVDLRDGCLEGRTLGEYLSAGRYSKSFVDDHLLPMGAAIWSSPAESIRGYPADAFVRFFDNHGLLSVSGRPQWRTVVGGSRRYVDRMTEAIADAVRLGTPAREIHRHRNGVRIVDASGAAEHFDAVVLAVHADEALALLGDANRREQELLGAIRYTRSDAVLHTDVRLMPRRRAAWASWNYLSASDATDGLPQVTYWMNRLQGLETPRPLFVSLNPERRPAEHETIASFAYSHPVFDTRALEARSALWRLQGNNRTWFCGSYFGYGFHEDALQSGLAVAEALGGVRRPWRVPGESARMPGAIAKPVAAEEPSSPALETV